MPAKRRKTAIETSIIGFHFLKTTIEASIMHFHLSKTTFEASIMPFHPWKAVIEASIDKFRQFQRQISIILFLLQEKYKYQVLSLLLHPMSYNKIQKLQHQSISR